MLYNQLKEKTMEQVEQIFNPPLHLCLNSHDNVVEISKRLWNCEENHPICEQQVQKIGYIGQAQNKSDSYKFINGLLNKVVK